tara:strand:- start:2448 stop:2591 length:144 start_codon:yes stop_codon:yes gene_type:complete
MIDSKKKYVLFVKEKEVNRYYKEKDARKCFHKLVRRYGINFVKVEYI